MRTPVTPDTDEEQDLAALFAEYHAANPQVYAELVRLARELRAKGHQTLGIGMLWEVLRWQTMIDTQRIGGDFKLNNSYRSRYARLIMQREPDLAGIFETRTLKT